MKALLTLALVLTMSMSLGVISGCSDEKESTSSSTSLQSSMQSSDSFASALDSSSKEELIYFAVTFQQDGYEDIVMLIKNGEGISDIPQPQQKEGYTVSWELQDLSAITSDMIVKAVATPNEYTITFDANGGEVETSTLTVKYDALPSAFPVPTKEGYVFEMWKDEEGNVFTGSVPWKLMRNVTLTATWRQLEKYTITFQMDGQNEVREVYKGYDLAEEDIPSPPTKTGYTVAWNQSDLEKITGVEENVTIAYVATPNEYTVSFDVNGGDEEITQSIKVLYDDMPQASFPMPTREGFFFSSWKYGEQTIRETDVWKIASDVTLKADWREPETFVAIFVQTGCDDVEVSVVEGGTLSSDQIPEPQQNVSGYTVVWREEDLAGLTYITGNVFVYTESHPNVYEISFDTNGGVETYEAISVVYDGAIPVLPVPAKEGKFFSSWTYEGNVMVGGATWRIASNATLVAQWRDPYVYEVQFVQEGQPVQIVEITEGTSFTGELPPLQTTGEYYEGYEWMWQDFDRNNITGPITVYAVAKAKTYSVTINAGEGGSFIDAKTSLQVSVQYGKIPSWEKPTRTGYKFLGFYDGETLVDVSAPWNRAVDGLILTAKWEKKKFTVNFDLNGGSGSFTTMTVEYGESYEISAPTTWDTTGEYVFSAWKYGGERVALSGVWEYDFASSNITLTAEWTKVGTGYY